MNLILEGFLAFVRIGAMVFGGAYAAIPIVEQEVVDVQGWMTYAEFMDLLALDEVTPGPILINSATFVGMRVAGIPGAIAATLGVIIIPCTLVMVLLALYRHFKDSPVMDGAMVSLKCMAVALIASTFVRLGANALLPEGAFPDLGTTVFSVAVMCTAFWLINRRKIAPLPVMLSCGAANLIAHLLFL